jgi:hypothetical protein
MRAVSKRNRACDQHAQIKQTPTSTKGPVDVILQECSAPLYGQSESKRGGTGPDANLTPDPRTTTHLNRKSKVVE